MADARVLWLVVGFHRAVILQTATDVDALRHLNQAHPSFRYTSVGKKVLIKRALSPGEPLALNAKRRRTARSGLLRSWNDCAKKWP